MLDDVSLIHMNGRVYDPDLGRFLSPDPHIQSPANPQSHNRYTYVLNNPLSFTDPSGFFFKKIFKGIGKVFKGIGKGIKALFKSKFLRTVVAIGIAAIPGAQGAAIYLQGFAAGFVASGGDIKAGIIGALTAGAFNAIGTHFDAIANKVVNGVKQGLSTLGGADPSSAFGGFDYVHNATIGAIVGGTAAVLGGGKFASGALTGAFSRLFNDVATQTQEKFDFRKVDARPDEFTRADLIDEGINKIVNSPDGIIFIRTELDADLGHYVQKDGNQLNFPSENASATFEVIDSNKVELSNIVRGKGVKNLTITAHDNGAIKVKGIPFLYRAIIPTKYE